MIPALRREIIRAGIVLLISSFAGVCAASAATIDSVTVSVHAEGAEMPTAVKERIEAGILSIGRQVLIGKDAEVFSQNKYQYDKVLGDIVNRVVLGYVVSDLSVDYGSDSQISVTLLPVGKMIEQVDTEINYGNLSPAARELVQKDLSDVQAFMQNLLIGLPVDSIGWAESVSRSAGKDAIGKILPEFQANFEVIPDTRTKVRIYLIPKGTIVRDCKITFRQTTIPRIFLLGAVNRTEAALKELEGLPVAFLERHRADIENHLNEILENDSFIKRYQIETTGALIPGANTEFIVNALTDHWLIRMEAWVDMGRDGNKNTALRGILGHFIGENNLIFGETEFYPGPVDWNVYSGIVHRFGDMLRLGYKYDFVENSNHLFGSIPFGQKFSFRYDRDFRNKENEFGLSYRIHNYMTLEYVYNDEEGKWLRLVANL